MSASPTELKHRTEEQSRYDRSERLWGAAAQQRLRDGHVLLLGASATGCEILKNMTLPGLGNFTIVDGSNTSIGDLGKNFFLEQSDQGKPRAPAAAALLNELNPLVTGKGVFHDEIDFVEKELIAKGAEGIKAFSLIIASNSIPASLLVKLGNAAKGTDVPVVSVSAVGLGGLLRIQSDNRHLLHIVPDPDLKVEDMRPFHPFPALQEFFDRLNPDDASMPDEVHSHLPWFVIVHFAVRKWQKENNHPADKLPALMEWKVIKATVEGMMRKKEGGALEDNFIEARDMCNAKLLVNNRWMPELKAILEDSRCKQPSKDDNVFWFAAHALLKFKEANNGLMPLPGSIPDFHTSTQLYKDIQVLFRNKGVEDATTLHKIATEALTAAGRDPADASFEYMKEVAEHAWELHFITYPSMEEQFASKIDETKLSAPSDDLKYWYLAHHAAQVFYDREKRHAGSGDNSTVETDLRSLLTIAAELYGGATVADMDQHLAELVRAGGGEPVAIAAILGAAAAQECIKLIQNRRVPISHSLVFDGIGNVFGTIKETN